MGYFASGLLEQALQQRRGPATAIAHAVAGVARAVATVGAGAHVATLQHHTVNLSNKISHM